MLNVASCDCGAAAGLAPALPAFADQAAPARLSESAKLRALFDAFFQQHYSAARTRHQSWSRQRRSGGTQEAFERALAAAVARNAADTERRLNELRSIDRAALPGPDAV